MNTGSSGSLDSRAWRGLYRAALFEIDEIKLPERIAQAEKAIALRARDLFHMAGDNDEEDKLWMTLCMPCMLWGTARKRTAVSCIAVRLLRSTHNCRAVLLRRPGCTSLPTVSFVHVVEKCTLGQN
jgi:hypothetical protein